jgi:hypothetical protein
MMMQKNDQTLRAALLVIVVLLGVLVLRPFFEPTMKVSAQAARFDHVVIASTMFLYKGQQGMLVLDKRNANVWFFPRVNEEFKDPIYLMRLPFDKIDQEPR